MYPLGMPFTCPHFRTGVALTLFIGVLSAALARLAVLDHVGTLSIALLLGIAARAFLHVPENQHVGIGFSARSLLRLGIVLVGVRLNFELLFLAGPRILVLAASIITCGLVLIAWLGRAFGLPGVLPLLMAVDSSICGASAAAAAAPVIRARSEDIALVVPLCSLIGTAGVLLLTGAQQVLQLSPDTFGVLAGATLHEVAQVMAATSAIPDAIDPGAITKLTRVTLLAPAVIVLGWVLARRNQGAGRAVNFRALLGSVWFVFGFLAVGGITTLATHVVPAGLMEAGTTGILHLATFLMAMAMAGLGLQVDFVKLRENGFRAAAVGVIGWLFLLGLAAGEIWALGL